MLRTYRLIWGVLSGPERRSFVLLILLTIVMSVFDVIGIGGILPFLTVLSNPAILDTNPALLWFASTFGLETHRETTIALGFAVFALILLSTAVRAVGTYAQIRFSLMRAYSLASRLLQGHLGQNYVWYLSRNTADLGSTLLSEVDMVVRESVLPSVFLISNTLVIVMIAGLLFVVAPTIAMGATGLLLAVYMVVYFGMRGHLDRVGTKRVAANRSRFQVVQEISGGLKELKVKGLEGQSLARFRRPAQEMARYQTQGLVIGRLPRFAVEAAVYGAFIGMILFMMLRGDPMADLLPLLGLLGMAATRLFPALQQVYLEMSQIRFSASALQRLHDDLQALGPLKAPAPDAAPIHLQESLQLHDIRFRFPGSERDTLQGFSVTVPARSTLGVVGGTGAGKTTLIDIMLGLHTPDSGSIFVDGQEVGSDRIRAWQKTLGYVPQDIFLTDDTVAANIAFGQDPSKVDMRAVERAARIANLHEFVMSDLPEGYATFVGERGVRLSGGQRQRIGIARALYHDPDVLILDEATSALDNLTERAVMEAVHNLGGNKTVIMIAHRLSTVRNCDKIVLMEGGRLVAQGTYLDLISKNERFRQMATGS